MGMGMLRLCVLNACTHHTLITHALSHHKTLSSHTINAHLTLIICVVVTGKCGLAFGISVNVIRVCIIRVSVMMVCIIRVSVMMVSGMMVRVRVGWIP